MIIVRYAADVVLGFQHRWEAERFLTDLRARPDQFGLALHPDKTRLIEFGRLAAPSRRRRGPGKPETFDFPGFTHICSATRKGRRFTIKRKTIAKRLRAKLSSVKAALRRRMHGRLADTAEWLRSVAQGFMTYHAVPGALASVKAFRMQVARLWFRTLRRRGDRRRLTWARFGPFANRWLPRARILHAYPDVRFRASHPR